MIEGASDIYTFLLKNGPKMAIDITKFLGGNKALVYRRLKFLMLKDFIKSTLDFPARFEAVPLDLIIVQFTENKKRELYNIKKSGEKLQDIIKNLNTEAEPLKDEFSIIKGSYMGIIKCQAIAKQTKTEYLLINDQLTPFHHDFIKDMLLIASQTLRKKVNFKFITNVDYGNLNKAKEIIKKLNLDSPYIEIRHLSLHPDVFPRFALGDERAIVFFFDTLDFMRPLDPEKLFWTTNLAFIRSMKLLFNELWRNSVDIRVRIDELEGNESQFLPFQKQESFLQPSFHENILNNDGTSFKNGHYTCGAKESKIDLLSA